MTDDDGPIEVDMVALMDRDRRATKPRLIQRNGWWFCSCSGALAWAKTQGEAYRKCITMLASFSWGYFK